MEGSDTNMDGTASFLFLFYSKKVSSGQEAGEVSESEQDKL